MTLHGEQFQTEDVKADGTGSEQTIVGVHVARTKSLRPRHINAVHIALIGFFIIGPRPVVFPSRLAPPSSPSSLKAYGGGAPSARGERASARGGGCFGCGGGALDVERRAAGYGGGARLAAGGAGAQAPGG